MLFNSYIFIFIFLPAVFVIFWSFCFCKLTMAAKVWLFLSSLFFYGFWDIRFFPLLLASILFNYCTGKYIEYISDQKRKIILFVGIIANLSFLFYFKYSNFFIKTLSRIYGDPLDLGSFILPLGISFFTFTQIAYLIDAYKGRTEKSNLISYGLFVTVFPHLIAGPILHHKRMLTQFNDEKTFIWSWNNMASGLFLFILGLFKKVIIADCFAGIASPIFDGNVSGISFVESWIGALSYTLQLYFDFSGYSDMACGLGLFFNLYLPYNFNSPYKADSIIDFWRRWHISLSSFLRDYLYIPLGGSKKGLGHMVRNIMITMILGGIWHGAGTTFVIWGGYHGFVLVLNHLWRRFNLLMPIVPARLLTFLAVVIGWVVFRSPSMRSAARILRGMTGVNGFSNTDRFKEVITFSKHVKIFDSVNLPTYTLETLLIAGLMIAVTKMPNSLEIQEKFYEKPLRWAFASAVLFFLCMIQLDNISEFIYYRF